MKTIIATTDYSPTATNAVYYAAQLANVLGCRLVLFNAYRLSVHASNDILMTPERMDNMTRENNEQLETLGAALSEQFNIPVDYFSKLSSDTVEDLVAYTTAHPTEIVVMGMDSDIPEYKVFGNTTTATIRRLKFPVLVVPNEYNYKGIKKIVYACESKYLNEDNELGLLKEFTKKYDAELQVLHIETNAKDVTADEKHAPLISTMDKVLEGVKHSYNFVHNGNIRDGIAEGIKAFDADLLVMVPHEAGFLELLLKGSITRQVTLKTRVPVLVAPNP